MDGPTRSSNHRASLALLLAITAVLVVPAAIAVARQAGTVALLDAAYAVPLAFLLGVFALLFARGAHGRVQWTVGRAGGEGRIHAARVLAVLAICIAVTGAIAVGVYELLVFLER